MLNRQSIAWKPTTHKCPSCLQPLVYAEHKGKFYVYCPWGICASQACNIDHDGETLGEALTKLAAAFDREYEMESE